MFRLLRQKRKNRDVGGKKAGKQGSGSRRHTPIRTTRSLFHGVCVVPDPVCACDAVQDLTGVRFLAEEAPKLPLSDCSNAMTCGCKYQHFDDRRTDLRRESDIGLPMRDHPEDARSGFGRRVTDG